jgi:rRNA maturation protein Nop10
MCRSSGLTNKTHIPYPFRFAAPSKYIRYDRSLSIENRFSSGNSGDMWYMINLPYERADEVKSLEMRSMLLQMDLELKALKWIWEMWPTYSYRRNLSLLEPLPSDCKRNAFSERLGSSIFFMYSSLISI